MPSSPPSEGQSEPLPTSPPRKTDSWKCHQCGEIVEASFDSCWRCAAKTDAASPSSSSATRSRSPVPPVSEARLRGELTGVLSTALLFLFFLPWIARAGFSANGLTLQKYSENYQMVWLIPALAFVTLCLNLARINVTFIRRLTGAAPLGLFAYALTRFGEDLMSLMAPAAWGGVIVGLMLVIIPGEPKPKNPS